MDQNIGCSENFGQSKDTEIQGETRKFKWVKTHSADKNFYEVKIPEYSMQEKKIRCDREHR